MSAEGLDMDEKICKGLIEKSSRLCGVLEK